MLTSFTRNYQDNSTKAGFQFTFYCDICNDGYKSSFVESETYKKGKLFRAAGQGASVIGGLVDCPVIAVPTSVGYGASFGGVAALLAMLNSCASGISVVNIDNGFGAAYQASLINHLGGAS